MDIERFWSKTTPEPTSGCLLWTGNYHAHGYGRTNMGRRGIVLAHRLAWELTFGPIPDGLCVLHRCDNPPCVNPNHLFLGTKADNSADMVAKGRSCAGDRQGMRRHPECVPRGERNGQARLAEADVIAIRAARATGQTEREVAARFGVSPSLVGCIHRRERWRHISSGMAA